jgi:hypothetical protein
MSVAGAGSSVAVLAGVYLVVSAGLGIAEPWGHYTILYVMGLGGGIAVVMTLTAVAVLAVQESRRARRLRAQRSEAGNHRRDSSNKRGQR